MPTRSQLVAIAGGSGSGKTWLATELQRRLGKRALSISLDDFYLDRSNLTEAQRRRVNYDHPRAIDWALFERLLSDALAGRLMHLPRYDFASHTQKPNRIWRRPRPVIIVEGLWLLRRPSIRSLFDWLIFIDCPATIRLERRLQRDVVERGRDPGAVKKQFSQVVSPMHRRFVQPQSKWADLVYGKSVTEAQIENLVERLSTPGVHVS